MRQGRLTMLTRDMLAKAIEENEGTAESLF